VKPLSKIPPHIYLIAFISQLFVLCILTVCLAIFLQSIKGIGRFDDANT